MRKILILFIFILTLSCKQSDEMTTEYDKNGKIISKIYGNPEESLDSIIYFKNGVIDSKMIAISSNTLSFYVKYYDDYGNLKSEGFTFDKIKIGKWKFYDSKTKNVKIVEFKNICGVEYPNQEWNYNNKGKLNLDIRSYYTYKFKNSEFKNGGTNFLTVKYIPLVKKGSVCTINFSNEIDSKFCNIDKIKKISFRSSESKTFSIPMMLVSKGKKNFRGYIEEISYEKINNSKLLQEKLRRVYIDIPFEVK